MIIKRSVSFSVRLSRNYNSVEYRSGMELEFDGTLMKRQLSLEKYEEAKNALLKEVHDRAREELDKINSPKDVLKKDALRTR